MNYEPQRWGRSARDHHRKHGQYIGMAVVAHIDRERAEVKKKEEEEILIQVKAQHRSQMDDLLGLARSIRNYLNVNDVSNAHTKAQETVDYLEKYFGLGEKKE